MATVTRDVVTKALQHCWRSQHIGPSREDCTDRSIARAAQVIRHRRHRGTPKAGALAILADEARAQQGPGFWTENECARRTPTSKQDRRMAIPAPRSWKR